MLIAKSFKLVRKIGIVRHVEEIYDKRALSKNRLLSKLTGLLG
jgi:hypothetical protein